VFYRETNEVKFNSGFVLNVISVCFNSKIILIKLKKVFLYRLKKLQTVYIY